MMRYCLFLRSAPHHLWAKMGCCTNVARSANAFGATLVQPRSKSPTGMKLSNGRARLALESVKRGRPAGDECRREQAGRLPGGKD
ncbi:hypothetical protein C3384_01625 [Klebsiella aerogenes]|nr:hypothetical protein C4J64_18355 [Klebsiella aerogenes]POU61769.1 hypothetical protein C3384_01625 [Klebsiella aerogenes]PYZ47109.1 hypothetical protein DNK66_15050 [Klebsiella aerogenes]RNT16551.1 hypothetical protein B9Z99_010565 [Klebsiella aerogenes]RSV91536.1 hypothetical protein EGH57_05120 [Klebsiella aerogenes]